MIRQAHLIAVVLAFLIGCAVFLMAGASGVQAQASNKEEARCEGTSTTKNPIVGTGGGAYTTNDLPGCPKGGPLLGTDDPDELAGKDGDDEIRGLGAKDDIYGGPGSDVIYGGPGKDWIDGNKDEDVLYGGDGNDYLGAGSDGQRDKLYCGKGKDFYFADKKDYVDSSCEKGKLVDTGGPPLLLLAGAALCSALMMLRYVIRSA